MRPDGYVQHLGGDRWRLFVEVASDSRRTRRTRVVRAANERAARKLLAPFAVEARTPAVPVTTLTVDELLDRWLAHRAAAAKQTSTVADWRRKLDRYVRPRIGTMAAAEVTAYVIDRLYADLLAGGGKDGRALKGSTVRHVHTALRLAFAQAVRWSWLPANPAEAASPPEVEKVHLPPPSAADVATLVAHAEGTDPDAAAVWRLDASTGSRRGELAGIQWGDVDLDGGQVAIHRVVKEIDGQVVVVDYPKTSSSRRRIALSPLTVAALKAMRKRAVERALAAGIPLQESAFLVSRDVAGRTPVKPMVLTTRLRRLSKAAGVGTITPQVLRRFMATQALGAGVDVRTVAGRGGWSNATTLLTRYAHWLPARDQAAAELLDDLLATRKVTEG